MLKSIKELLVYNLKKLQGIASINKNKIGVIPSSKFP